ncbi:Auxin response factor 16 [Zostera marina]|uniref:Auxin response factor n=1 Tax=Zostera marina TaxID=29655 RepID=A0A0K9NWH4_ZOSMR|nr:Auxin response factor 16 [Zostera marina]
MTVSDLPHTHSHFIDHRLWKAIAGNVVVIPTVGSRVYYFPQGHAEHSHPVPDVSHFPLWKPWSMCRVTDVNLLANLDSDEVYYKALLLPTISTDDRIACQDLDEKQLQGDSLKFESFSKTLTQSDANNGGGFSVPRFCADTILPPLDYNQDPPVQTISAQDVHGRNWDFRHIYRGTPRRHLLTTGWSRYVNYKRLIAGDSIVFAKNSEGSIFIGIRRGNDVLRRNSRYRVTPENAMHAAGMATMEAPFEVVFYPRRSTEYVVKASMVEESMRIPWESGMRVRMPVEGDDNAGVRTSWHQGTITYVNSNNNPIISPWRMLQVAWDEPEICHNNCVSPWQVEIVPGTHIMSPYSSSFMRFSRGGAGCNHNHNSTVVSGMTMSLLNDEIPVGMQGARQNLSTCMFAIKPENDSGQSWYSSGNLSPYVSTELNIYSPPDGSSESLSPESQSSVLESITTPKSASAAAAASAGTGTRSFLLFGKLIQLEDPSSPTTSSACCKTCENLTVCSCERC